MAKEVFCGKCGTRNEGKRFKCSQCHALLRPVYPTAAAIAAIAGIYALWLVYMAAVLPTLAVILGSHGVRFSLLVRVAVTIGQYFTGGGILLGFLLLALLFWLGLCWQPQKSLGSNVVVTVALLKGIGTLLVVLLSVLDVFPFLTAK